MEEFTPIMGSNGELLTEEVDLDHLVVYGDSSLDEIQAMLARAMELKPLRITIEVDKPIRVKRIVSAEAIISDNPEIHEVIKTMVPDGVKIAKKEE